MGPVDSWPQISRCLLAQWRGYPKELRQAIDQQWQYDGTPGVLPAAGNAMFNIWWVERYDKGVTWTTCGDLLMSIKEDLVPASMLVDKLVPKA